MVRSPPFEPWLAEAQTPHAGALSLRHTHTPGYLQARWHLSQSAGNAKGALWRAMKGNVPQVAGMDLFFTISSANPVGSAAPRGWTTADLSHSGEIRTYLQKDAVNWHLLEMLVLQGLGWCTANFIRHFSFLIFWFLVCFIFKLTDHRHDWLPWCN